MILTAKKTNHGWKICDEVEVVFADAKLQKKNKSIYGKIIYSDLKELDFLYNPNSFKNSRSKIHIYDNNKTDYNALYRTAMFDKKVGFYFTYHLRHEHQTYHGYHVKNKSHKSSLYIYRHNQLIAIIEFMNGKDGLKADIFIEDDAYVKAAVLFLITHDAFLDKKVFGVKEYAPVPLKNTDNYFLQRVKENCLKENFYDN